MTSSVLEDVFFNIHISYKTLVTCKQMTQATNTTLAYNHLLSWYGDLLGKQLLIEQIQSYICSFVILKLLLRNISSSLSAMCPALFT